MSGNMNTLSQKANVGGVNVGIHIDEPELMIQ